MVASLGAARCVSGKDAQLSGSLSCVGRGGGCRVEECAEWVRCSFLLAESGVEPAARALEVVCLLLWCRVCPRFRCQGCYEGGRELWV